MSLRSDKGVPWSLCRYPREDLIRLLSEIKILYNDSQNLITRNELMHSCIASPPSCPPAARPADQSQ